MIIKKALKKAGIYSRVTAGELGRALVASADRHNTFNSPFPVGVLKDCLQARNQWRTAIAHYYLMTQEKRRFVEKPIPIFERPWGIRDLLAVDKFQGNMIGVEIEKLVPSSVPNSNLAHRFVCAVSDGSICEERGFYGLESRLVFVRGISENRVTSYCKKLQDAGCKVNKSCGLHIHLDQRDVARQTAWRRFGRLVEALPWLKMAVPPSRIGNQYCRLNTSTTPDSDRYKAINWLAYGEHTTLEVRLFNGTIDATKILHWVNLCVASSMNYLPTFESMMDSNAIPTASKVWYLERRKKFYGDVGGGELNEDSSN